MPSWMTLPASVVWMTCLDWPMAKDAKLLTEMSENSRSASGPLKRRSQRNDQSPM